MRRLTTWLAGAAGVTAAYRVLVRRRGAASRPVAPVGPDPRAEELRARLAAAREQAHDHAGAEPEPERAGPEERRREVHERGRAALDEMHGE